MGVATSIEGVRRRWVPANARGETGPTADADLDHPAPSGAFIEADHVPFLLAPDPGGVAPRAGTVEFLVEPLQTPVQHSPITNWNQGSPYPGPPARVQLYVDQDSAKWWGRTGQGQLVWSEQAAFSADLPPNLPTDLVQHIDSWNRYMGGYPSLARNRPTAFADQVPVLQPVAFDLPEG